MGLTLLTLWQKYGIQFRLKCNSNCDLDCVSLLLREAPIREASILKQAIHHQRIISSKYIVCSTVMLEIMFKTLPSYLIMK